MERDSTCPQGMVRVEYWGGEIDGKQEIVYPESVTETRSVLAPVSGMVGYRLYAIEIDRQEIDEYHRPIFALYVEESVDDGEEIWWVGDAGWVGEEEND